MKKTLHDSWLYLNKKHRVLLDVMSDFIRFFLRFYIHFRVFFSFISFKLIEATKKIFKIKQIQIIIWNLALKKLSIENLDDFLKTTNKFFKKKW